MTTAAPPSVENPQEPDRFGRFCADLGPGLITSCADDDLSGVIRTRYPRWVLWGACALLVTANVINMAADLGGMGQGAELVTGISSLVWIPLFGAVITAFLLGILSTTISPYLFFWQASQEVEEERAQGRTLQQRKGATDEELRRLRVDVMTGMFASNLIMYPEVMGERVTPRVMKLLGWITFRAHVGRDGRYVVPLEEGRDAR